MVIRPAQPSLIAFDRTGRTVSLATLLALGGAAAPAWSQVISVQPSGPLDSGAYVGSARMQYGLTQPSTYQGAVLGGGRITTDQQAAVVAAGGFAASTNPPFWSQAGSPGNRFTLQYVAATNTFSLTVRSPGGGVVNFSIADTQDLSSARGLNLNWTALLGSTFGNIQLTSAGQTIALGPAAGVWSTTSLANSTLTGWDLGADWTITGRTFMQAGQDAAPALQMDVLNQGLGYQLSGPGILNYGVLQDLVITDAEFQQAQFGGTDGEIAADIQSKGAVTFDVAGNVTFRGDIADLTSALVAPASQGAASLVKDGAGRLNLRGTSSFTGTTTIEDGTLGIVDQAQLGTAAFIMGDGSGIGAPALSLDASGGSMSFGKDVQLAAGADASVISQFAAQDVAWSASITGAVGTSLTFRDLTVGFTGDASAMLGDVIADGSVFTAAGANFAGNFGATGGADADITGAIAGNLSVSGSTIRASGGDNSVPGSLAVGGNLTFDAASTYVANVFLTEFAPGQRDADLITVAGAANMDGKLVAVVDTDVSPGPIAPGRGETKTWRVISTAAGAGQFDVAKLVVLDPTTGSSNTINLPINTSIDRGAVRYTTAFDATGATITLTGLAAIDPNSVIQTNCGKVSGAEINSIVDRLDVIALTGSADASMIAGELLLFEYSKLPAAYAATGQRNPYAAPDVILDAQFMGGQTAMLRLMQLRDGGMGRAAARSADAASGKAPGTAGQQGAAQAGAQPEFGAPLNGPTPNDGTRGWTRDYGFFESVDGQDCYACGYDAAIGSVMVGADWDVDGGGIVGVFGGAGPGRISQDPPNGSQEEMIGNFQLGIYGSWVPGKGAFYAQGFLLGGYDTIDRTRTIEIPGLQRTANSANSAWTVSAGGEAGLNLDLGERTFLQPYVGVAWGQFWGGGYTETGADSLNMTVQAQSANEWQPTAGARLMRALQSGTDVVTPYLGAAFLAQLPVGDGWAPAWTSDFQLGEQQRLATAPIDRYGVSFQAGVEVASIKGITAFIAFDGAVITGKQRFGGQVGVLVPF